MCLYIRIYVLELLFCLLAVFHVHVDFFSAARAVCRLPLVLRQRGCAGSGGVALEGKGSTQGRGSSQKVQHCHSLSLIKVAGDARHEVQPPPPPSAKRYFLFLVFTALSIPVDKRTDARTQTVVGEAKCQPCVIL